MCGRYTLMTEDEYVDIQSIISQVQNNLYNGPVATGEIFPASAAPIVMSRAGEISIEAAVWGFPGFKAGSVIINARSETAAEKPMFRDSFAASRCIVPTTGFYEWDKSKHKYLFRLDEGKSLYLAGLYKEFKGEGRYVILTADSVGSVKDIHDRMPVIVSKSKIRSWLCDTDAALNIMLATPPELMRFAC